MNDDIVRKAHAYLVEHGWAETLKIYKFNKDALRDRMLELGLDPSMSTKANSLAFIRSMGAREVLSRSWV